MSGEKAHDMLTMISREEVQLAADIRMMAMAGKQRAGHIAGKQAYLKVLDRIIGDCEWVILNGPPAFHPIIEQTASAAEVERALRQRAYPDRYD